MNVIGKKHNAIPNLANTLKTKLRSREHVQLSPGQQAALQTAQATLARLTNCLLKVASSGAGNNFKKHAVPLPSASIKSESPYLPTLTDTIANAPVNTVIPTPLPANDPPIAPSHCTEEQRYLDTLTLGADTVRSLKNRFQFTNAAWLEKCVNTQKKKGINSDEEYKKAREQIEDAIDCLDDVPLLEQLLSLPETAPVIAPLKGAIVADLRSQLNALLTDLGKKKEQFLELLKSTPENSYRKSVLHFIQDRESKSVALQSTYTTYRNPLTGHQVNLDVDTLDSQQLASYNKAVEEFIASTHEQIEQETRLQYILPLKQSYNFLDSNSLSAIATLETNNNFLCANLLDKALIKHSKLLEAATKNLTSTAQMNAYAKTLENAIKDLTQKLLISQTPPKEPIDQLLLLNERDFPYYELLRNNLIKDTRAKIDACVSQLETYHNLLAAALPILEVQKREDYPAILAIRDKIESKKVEIQALRTSFITRAFFWHVFPQQTPLEALPSDKLVEYIKFVDHTIQKTLEDLGADAAQSGFSWN